MDNNKKKNDERSEQLQTLDIANLIKIRFFIFSETLGKILFKDTANENPDYFLWRYTNT